MMPTTNDILPLADGTVYSRRKNFCPFSTPPLEAYASALSEEKMERDHKRVPTSREDGFTLLEVIIAIAILTFGLLAVASMQSAAIRGNYLGYRVTEGATLAQDRMEFLLGQPFGSLTVGTDQPDPDPISPNTRITYDVAPVPGGANALVITVKVQPVTGGGKRSTELTCVRPAIL